MSSSKTLKDLFLVLPKNKKRKIKRLNPVSFEEYIQILNCITSINIKNIDHFKYKYQIYCEQIRNKIYSFNLTSIGIYSKLNTNIQYYLDRGWNELEAKEKLKNRQSTISKLSAHEKERYNKKRSNTFSINYKLGNHKKFLRPSEIEYWINLGYDSRDAKIKMHDYYSIIGKKFHEKLRKNGKQFLTVRQIDFWISRGLTYQDAIFKIKEIQTTTTLEKFTELYGKEEGLKRFNLRNERWLKTLNDKSEEEKLDILIRKTRYSKRYSKSSIDLFDTIFKILEKDHKINFNKIYYKENEYFIFDENNKQLYFYDLLIKDINLIIEYNGIKFHPNKEKLSESEWLEWRSLIGNNNAESVYKRDKNKEKIAKLNGFNYIVIWEDESFERKIHKIINKILELYENKRY